MNDVSEFGMDESRNPDEVWLDVRGEFCPVPAARAKQQLDELSKGAQLKVWTTDPLAPVDLEVLCERLGHRLISHAPKESGVVTTIERR